MEIINTLEGINRLVEAEDRISYWKDKFSENTQSEQQKIQEFLKMRTI